MPPDRTFPVGLASLVRSVAQRLRKPGHCDPCVFEKFCILSSKANCGTHLNLIIIQRQVIIIRPLLGAELLCPPPLLLFLVCIQGIYDWDCVIDCILISLHLHFLTIAELFGRIVMSWNGRTPPLTLEKGMPNLVLALFAVEGYFTETIVLFPVP